MSRRREWWILNPPYAWKYPLVQSFRPRYNNVPGKEYVHVREVLPNDCEGEVKGIRYGLLLEELGQLRMKLAEITTIAEALSQSVLASSAIHPESAVSVLANELSELLE